MIKSFSDLNAAQQALAGGKGGTLARLYQAGFPVPDGLVILPQAFNGDELRPEAWRRVKEEVDRLRSKSPATSLAVRSSALAEDSVQASFAGGFETVLGAQGDREIRDAIRTVRRSGRSGRVQVYSQAKGIDPVHEIAVIVQQQIPADISGILFTIDPVSEDRTRMAGSFVHGLGETLVAGEATGETFTIERPAGQYRGPAEIRGAARELFGLARRLERELGSPQDIEWAIAGSKLFLLQSRPITTLIRPESSAGNWNDSLTGDYLWSNVNFGEAVTDVMTPLSWTVLKLIFGEWAILPGYDTVGNIGGRPYLNISLYASLFHALGKSHQDLLETLEGTLYMQLPEGMKIPLIPLSKRYLFSAMPSLIRTRIKEWRGVKSLPGYLASNPAWFRKTRDRIQKAKTQAELRSLWVNEIYPHVTGSVWKVMGTVSSSTAYTMKLRRELEDLVGSDDANVLISNLSDDSGLLASLGPVVGIARVARGEMERDAYLAQYGHRGADEFELSVPRPAEDPNWIEEQVVRYHNSPVDVEALIAKQRRMVEEAWERFQAQYPRKSVSMCRRLNEAARRAQRRELARSEYVRDRWVIRLFALRAGELSALGKNVFFLTLDELLDVLNGEEDALQGIPARKKTYERYRTLPPYPPIILGRFDPIQWASDPDRRSDIFDSHNADPAIDGSAGHVRMITGSPGSTGRVEALVRRLDDPEEGDQLQAGEVLVTAHTDIAWTMLFPRAAAIVTDVGAPLSHAAIVARELGIPAVVGCGDATMRLATGDRVRVDGAQGVVEILDQGEA